MSFGFCQPQMFGVESWTMFGTCTEPLQGEQRIPHGSRNTLQSTLSCHLWSKLCTLIFYLLSLFKGELAAGPRNGDKRKQDMRGLAKSKEKDKRRCERVSLHSTKK